MDMETMLDLYWKLVWASAVGQLIFLIMWAVLPWWKEWVGRALMLKSFAFGAVLWLQLMFKYKLNDMAIETKTKIALAAFALITLGVWSQVFAIGNEIRKGRMYRKNLERQSKIVSDRCDQL